MAKLTIKPLKLPWQVIKVHSMDAGCLDELFVDSQGNKVIGTRTSGCTYLRAVPCTGCWTLFKVKWRDVKIGCKACTCRFDGPQLITVSCTGCYNVFQVWIHWEIFWFGFWTYACEVYLVYGGVGSFLLDPFDTGLVWHHRYISLINSWYCVTECVIELGSQCKLFILLATSV